MKTLPIKLLLLFSLLLVIYSCEKENEIIENHNEFVINEFNFKDLISNPIFQEGYQKLNYRKSNFKDYNKSSKNDIYNFTIDSSKIKKVEMNDYTSFTLLIKRPFETPEYFENLLIEKSGGIIKAYLIKYNLLSDIESFDEHQTFSFDATTSVIPLSLDRLDATSKSTGECSPVAQTWCNWGGEPHVAGHACFMADDGRTYLVYVVDENCTETDPSLDNTGGGEVSGTETEEPIIISPVDPDGNSVDFTDATTANEINHILGNSLSDNQLLWLFDNARQADQIKLFLYNNSSSEAKAFAKEAIEALYNNGDIDLDNRLIYNPIEAQNYRNRMSPSEVEIFDNLNFLQKEGYLRAATQAYIYAESHFPNPVRNRLGDAFKHTFWNALSTVYIGEELTQQLTTAHEDINYNPNYPNHFKETQMDLHNNAQGRQIAYGAGRLYELVHQAMDDGELSYLNNLVFINGFWNASNTSTLTPTNQ